MVIFLNFENRKSKMYPSTRIVDPNQMLKPKVSFAQLPRPTVTYPSEHVGTCKTMPSPYTIHLHALLIDAPEYYITRAVIRKFQLNPEP